MTMGFSVDTLTAWTLSLTRLQPDTSIDVNTLRSVAETAEWLLNRWYRPMLGKR